MKPFEYGLAAALITVATIGLLTALGGTLNEIFLSIAQLLSP